MVNTLAKKKRTSRTRSPKTLERGPLSRDTYDLYWLDVSDSSLRDRSFKQHRVVEQDGSRSTIQPSLAEALHDHHVGRARVSAVLERLGHSEAAAFFSQELPKDNRTRKGNFGEVVASEHLVQRFGYSMPVFKLRYRDSQLPMRGEDIVAFELNDSAEIVRVVIGEAKAVIRFRRDTVVEALERLKSAFKPRPMTLSMLANILFDRGEDALAEQIDNVSFALAKRNFPRSHWIFLINETQPADPFAVIAEDTDPIDGLCCVGIELPELTELVDTLFDAGPVPAPEGE